MPQRRRHSSIDYSPRFERARNNCGQRASSCTKRTMRAPRRSPLPKSYRQFTHRQPPACNRSCETPKPSSARIERKSRPSNSSSEQDRRSARISLRHSSRCSAPFIGQSQRSNPASLVLLPHRPQRRLTRTVQTRFSGASCHQLRSHRRHRAWHRLSPSPRKSRTPAALGTLATTPRRCSGPPKQRTGQT